MKQMKVCANLQQDFTDAEKAQARENIGAVSVSDIPSIIRKDTYSGGTEYDLDTLLLDRQGSETAVIKSGSTGFGSTVPTPSLSSDEGKVPVSYYRDGRGYYLLEQYKDSRFPDSSSSDVGKVLAVDATGTPIWQTPTTYSAGQGIDITNDQISWEYTVGRNLHINQNNQIQTNLPGGIYDAPTAMSNNFTALSGANFAGAYRLGCRYNTNGKYELALIYTASGQSSTITFIGTETVIGINNDITVNPAAYIGETAYYTPSVRFGYNSSTIFDPALHKAIIYQGLAQIGPTSNTQIAIWQDNGNVKISFTSIEVGKVGSTL